MCIFLSLFLSFSSLSFFFKKKFVLNNRNFKFSIYFISIFFFITILNTIFSPRDFSLFLSSFPISFSNVKYVYQREILGGIL